MLGASLIELVNRLQTAAASVGSADLAVDLPQIVVVGSQSSGKSSLLESLVGQSFLPKGATLATRCPTILQLNKLEPGEQPYAQLQGRTGAPIYDFDVLQSEIQRRMHEIAPPPQIVATRIIVSIYSPDVVDLTLVDLPGVIRNPGPGQPADIGQQVRALIMQFIEPENSVILAVTAASQDLAVSDSLFLARRVDPEGVRTVGVLTKADMLASLTPVEDTLAQRKVPLKLRYGFFAVRNRTAEEEQLTITESRQKEKDFFDTKERLYRSLCGVDNLATSLNRILLAHIRATLPRLREMIEAKLRATMIELQAVGVDDLQDQQSETVLMSLLTRFSASYRDLVDGRSALLSDKQIEGGARVASVFSRYQRALRTIDPVADMSLDSVIASIRNHSPFGSSFGNAPDQVIKDLVTRKIRKITSPSEQTVEFVREELARIYHKAAEQNLGRFEALQSRVELRLDELLREYQVSAVKMITALIEVNCAYVNFRHPDFAALAERVRAQVYAPPPPPQQQVSVYDGNGHGGSAQHGRNGHSSGRNAGHGSGGGGGGGVGSKILRSPGSSSGGESGSFLDIFFGGNKGNKDSGSGSGSSSKQSQRLKQSEAEQRRSTVVRKDGVMTPLPAQITIDQTSLSEDERKAVQYIQAMVRAYFNVVCVNVSHNVEASIKHYLVDRSVDKVHTVLLETVLKLDSEHQKQLLRENDAIVMKRERLREQERVLRDAKVICAEFPVQL